jgi:hypothetical protein
MQLLARALCLSKMAEIGQFLKLARPMHMFGQSAGKAGFEGQIQIRT